ncbi:hypothetical protein [Streptomyces sp. NPDC101234]|uniref:hypothetical protein n=1 Tax=Streptomyces sp. NPDC101234 TaxID=3366138 RepID=UPI0038031647
MPSVVLDDESTRYVCSQLARIRRFDVILSIAFWLYFCCLWLLLAAAATVALWQFYRHQSGMAVAAGMITGGIWLVVRLSRRWWRRRRRLMLPPPALPQALR